jgi:SAM-dependent methyltransferase
MSLNHNKSYNIDIREWILKNKQYAKYLSTQKLVNRNCPVCKSSQYSHFANNDYLDYSKCENCGLIFMNPTIDESSVNDGFKGGDDLLMSYFKLMQKYKKFDTVSDVKPNQKEDNKLRDIYSLKQNGTLLDIGCSVGDFLYKAKYFYNVEGVEVNPNTSAYAKKYFTVHTDYLDRLELKKEYDIVTMHQILYGVPDTVSLLKDIHKVLKDDGILYINTPNSDSFAMKLFGGKVNHLYGYTSLNVFNRDSLEELAKLSGFQIKFYRTEWLDIYSKDIQEFYNNPDNFIHKRNTHLESYSQSIKLEDEVQKKINTDMKDGGNYIVAILEKS